MAQMYALPSLTTWDNSTVGGWSNTSGGVSNGTFPSIGTNVVFDANSGPSRTITIAASVTINSIDTSAAAGVLSFSGGANTVTVNGGSGTIVDLTKAATFCQLILTDVARTGAVLNLQGVSFTGTGPNSIVLVGGVTVNGNFACSGDINVQPYTAGGAAESAATLTFTGTAITCSHFVSTSGGFGGANTSTTVNVGGVWTLTGTGNVWNIQTNYQNTAPAAGFTMKVTDSSASSKTVWLSSFGNAQAANVSVWAAATGTGGTTLTQSLNGAVFSTLRVDPGCTLAFTYNGNYNFQTWNVVGSAASPATLTTTLPTNATFITTNTVGRVYLDYCNIKGITAIPANTFYARSSTDQGNNSGITYYKAKPNFAAFF